MPVPSSITDLSPDPNTNSPQGSEAVFPNLDNYLRTLSAFIRQLYDGPIQLSAMPDGFLTANTAGRAKMADLFVTLAKLSQDVQSRLAKPGDFKWKFGTSADEGWLICNGAAVSRTTYASLWAYAQISGCLASSEGTKQKGQFGPGNGTTTFTLPNLQDEFIRGIGSGRAVGTWQDSQNKEHSHPNSKAIFNGNHKHPLKTPDLLGAGQGNNPDFQASGDDGIPVGETGTAGGHDHDLSITNSGGSEARPHNVALLPLVFAGV